MGMNELIRDLRYASRSLLRNSGVSVIIIFTLAVGIGANSAIFTYLMEMHRARFAAPEPERLFYLRSGDGDSQQRLPHSMPDLLDIRDGLGDLAEFRGWGFLATVAVLPSGESLYTFASAVEPGYFGLYRETPHLGRFFLPEENTPTGPQVVVVDYGFWTRRLGSDPEIVGKTLEIGRTPYTIVGVGPQGFQGTGLTLPLFVPAIRLGDLTRREAPFEDREERAYFALLRLAEDASREVVAQRLEVLAATLDAEHPLGEDQQRRLFIEGVEEPSGELPSRSETILAVATIFLMLLACANAGNLFLTRMSTRRQEIALYAALGASSGRIARRVLLESCLLALASGALGLLLGRILLLHLRSYLEVLPIGMAGWATGTEWMQLDDRVVLFTFGLALFTGFLFALAPTRWALRMDLTSALYGGAGAVSSGAGKKLLGIRVDARKILVVVQFMLSTILVLGGVLWMQSLQGLSSRPLGFDPEDKIITAFATARDTSLEPLLRREQERRFYELGRSTLAALPEAVSAGLISEPPGLGTRTTRIVFSGGEEYPEIAQRIVDEHFFTTMDLAVQGRLFSPADRAESQGVAIVNEAFVESHFSEEEEALGRRFTLPDLHGVDVPEARFTVIGVADDMIHGSRRNPPEPMVYLSLRQVHRSSRMMVIVQARGPGALRSTLQVAAESVGAKIHPDLAFIEVGTFADQQKFDLSQERLDAVAATSFGLLGLGLALLGIYSVMNYSIVARHREIGIRRAVGATQADVVRAVLQEAALLIGLGMVLGVFASLLLTRWLESLLYGVNPQDPKVYLLVSAVLLIVGLGAAWLPASRAGEVDPNVVLRQV